MLLKSKAKVNLAIGSVIGVCVLAITIVTVLDGGEEVVKDESLITNFEKHEAQFQQLAAMANQDSAMRLVRDSVVGLSEGGVPPSYIYVEKGKPWPAEAQPLFSEERWREYLTVFQTLGLSSGSRNTALPNAVFFAASVTVSELDDYQAAVVEKGYAYVPRSVNVEVRDSLDNIDIDRPAIFYRKLQDQWYLYYEWAVSKPE